MCHAPKGRPHRTPPPPLFFPSTHAICPGGLLLLAFVNVNNLICLVGVIFAINKELWVSRVWVFYTMTIDNGPEEEAAAAA